MLMQMITDISGRPLREVTVSDEPMGVLYNGIQLAQAAVKV